MISRRRFLALSPVLAAAAAASPTSIVKDFLPQGPSTAGGDLTRSHFAPHVNSTFQVQLGALQHAVVRLLDVADLPVAGGSAAPAVDRERQFSLIFRGPLEQPFTQNTYHVEHPRMGTFALFLVPVGEAADGRHYQAIFNRIGAPPAREA